MTPPFAIEDPGRLDVEDVEGAGAGVCSAIGLEYWSGCGSSSTLKPMPVRSCHSGPEKFQARAPAGQFVGHVDGRALVLLRGLDGAIGRVLGRTFGRRLDRGGLRLAERRARIGELDRRPRRARARLVPSSARPGRARAVAPPSSTSRCRKVRRDRSPRSQASTSSVRPAWNSRRLRSLLIEILPDHIAQTPRPAISHIQLVVQANDIRERLTSSAARSVAGPIFLAGATAQRDLVCGSPLGAVKA